MSNPVIGFIGLGIMGKPMARDLIKAGYSLVVHNRQPRGSGGIRQGGAQPAAAPREVAESSEVVIPMLPDSPDAEVVDNGEKRRVRGRRIRERC